MKGPINLLVNILRLYIEKKVARGDIFMEIMGYPRYSDTS